MPTLSLQVELLTKTIDCLHPKYSTITHLFPWKWSKRTIDQSGRLSFTGLTALVSPHGMIFESPKLYQNTKLASPGYRVWSLVLLVPTASLNAVIASPHLQMSKSLRIANWQDGNNIVQTVASPQPWHSRHTGNALNLTRPSGIEVSPTWRCVFIAPCGWAPRTASRRRSPCATCGIEWWRSSTKVDRPTRRKWWKTPEKQLMNGCCSGTVFIVFETWTASTKSCSNW